MLNLTPTPNTHRQADNLMLLENNQYETRPGFFQVVSEPVSLATGWGEAIVYEQWEVGSGKWEVKSALTSHFPLPTSNLNIWHGTKTEPLTIPPESTFTATLFQSLTTLGNRENRLYLSNGKTLYYLHRTQQPGGEVTSVTVTPEELTLLVGAKSQLTGETVPKWAVNQNLTWSSADTALATVDDRGLVTAIAEGSVAITVTTEENSYTAQCQLTITAFIPVTAVTLDENDIELEIPKTITKQLTVTVEPDNATNPNVLWRSYDEAIATVDEFGIVTGVAEGETTVVVMSENGGLTDRAEITVTGYIAVTGVTVEPKTLELTIGNTGQLTATVEPEDASNKTISWASDDDEIATVSDTGLVTAVAEGTIFITVTTEEGTFADKCEVTVSAV